MFNVPLNTKHGSVSNPPAFSECRASGTLQTVSAKHCCLSLNMAVSAGPWLLQPAPCIDLLEWICTDLRSSKYKAPICVESACLFRVSSERDHELFQPNTAVSAANMAVSAGQCTRRNDDVFSQCVCHLSPDGQNRFIARTALPTMPGLTYYAGRGWPGAGAAQ